MMGGGVGVTIRVCKENYSMGNDFPQYFKNGKNIALFCLEEDWVKKSPLFRQAHRKQERDSQVG